MSRLKRYSLTLLMITGITFNISGAFAQVSDHVPGELLVMLRPGEEIDQVIDDIFLNPENQLTVHLISKRMNTWLIRFEGSLTDEDIFLSHLKKYHRVAVAQYNHYAEIRSIPNDPNFGSQWNMLNIGQVSGSIPGADVRATTAWDITTGGLTASGDTIVLAVVDDGFDLNHEDLKYWKNYAEVPGNSIDDDNNGYIDDYDGWNSISNNGVIPSANHGTEMAGVGGAIGNNSIGIAGVNWNVQIMPIKGVGTEAQAVAAYDYVLEMRKRYNDSNGQEGAFVAATNSSFGINNGKPDDFPLWCAMYDSLGKYGILNAAATTNSNVNVDVAGDIPTACESDYLVTVTNTTNTDQLAAAGYGLITIDLGAPGSGILTTFAGSTYSNANGTSPASPHVAGAIALLYSLKCSELVDDFKSDPSGAALRVKQFILDGVDSLLTLQGKTVTGGRLDVHQTLLLAGQYYHCNVGIDDGIVAGDIKVFPNPATDQLFISMEKNVPGLMITLLNLTGQEIISENLNGRTELSMDISSLPNGIYFLNITGKSNAVVKVIKE